MSQEKVTTLLDTPETNMAESGLRILCTNQSGSLKKILPLLIKQSFAGVDANSLNGDYLIITDSTGINFPISDPNGGFLLQLMHGSDYYIFQVFLHILTNSIYYRTKRSGEWREWRKVTSAIT